MHFGGIVPRVPASVLMPVQDLPAAMRAPADRWLVSDGETTARFESLVVRSMLARPLLVLRAGTRQPDSRAPGILRAGVTATLRREGRTLHGEVRAENHGDTVWLATTDDGVGAVSVGLQLLGLDQQPLDREFWRGALPVTVPPGGVVQVVVHAELPEATSAYRLKIDLVADRVCWFEDAGARPVVIDL